MSDNIVLFFLTEEVKGRGKIKEREEIKMNLHEIIAVILLIFLSILMLVKIIRDEKVTVKEWFLSAVTIAEKRLGAGTGQKKLKMVYGMFIERFPVLSTFLSYETFSKWVDIALEEIKEALSGKAENYEED